MDKQPLNQTEVLTDTKVRIKVPSSTKMAVAVAFLGIAAIAAAGAGLRAKSRQQPIRTQTPRQPVVEEVRLLASTIAYNHAVDYAKQAGQRMSEKTFWGEVVFTSNIFMNDSAVKINSQPHLAGTYKSAMQKASQGNFSSLKSWYNTIHENHNPAQLKNDVWLKLKERVMKKNLLAGIDVGISAQDDEDSTDLFIYHLDYEELLAKPLNPILFNLTMEYLGSMLGGSNKETAYGANPGTSGGSISLCLNGESVSPGGGIDPVDPYQTGDNSMKYPSGDGSGGGGSQGGGGIDPVAGGGVDPTAPAPLPVDADPTPEVNEPLELFGGNPLVDDCPPGFMNALGTDDSGAGDDADDFFDDLDDEDIDEGEDADWWDGDEPGDGGTLDDILDSAPGGSGTNSSGDTSFNLTQAGIDLIDGLVGFPLVSNIINTTDGFNDSWSDLPSMKIPGLKGGGKPKAFGITVFTWGGSNNMSPEQLLDLNACGGGMAGSLGSSGCMPTDALDWKMFMEALGVFWSDPVPIDTMYMPMPMHFLAIFDFVSGQKVLTDLLIVDDN